MEHSPAPWQACGHKRGGCQCGLIWCIPFDCVVATAVSEKDEGATGGKGVPFNGEQFHANARLIAAAPSYHEATMDMLRRHDANAVACNFAKCGCEECNTFRPIFEAAMSSKSEAGPAVESLDTTLVEQSSQ